MGNENMKPPPKIPAVNAGIYPDLANRQFNQVSPTVQPVGSLGSIGYNNQMNPAMPRYPIQANNLALSNLPIRGKHDSTLMLSNLTGWSTQDVERLRQEFMTYANRYGVMDREGFRKLYAASLLNTSWDALEREAEVAFRNFDANHTGFLGFDEYIAACIRIARDTTSRNKS